MLLYLDLETYSELDLLKTGVYPYAEHSSFEVLMTGWSLDGIPAQVITNPDQLRDQLQNMLLDPEVTKVAHNAGFDRIALQEQLGIKLDPAQWLDTAALAVSNGYPRALDPLAKALGAQAKDSAGTRLINLFSKPNKDGTRNTAETHPDQWQEFVAYCAQDVDSLVQVHELLPGWPGPQEQLIWQADQRINDTGIKVDLDLARRAVQQDEKNRVHQVARVKQLLEIDNPNSVQQFRAALAERGLELGNLRAETVQESLERTDISPVVREALQLRLELSLVAAKKYQAILAAACRDERIRGQFLYHGAHTGRWSSRGVQFQNQPRDVVQYPEATLLDVKLGSQADSTELRALVRSTFVGPFTVADYASIEARVLAWVAGEQWALDAFSDNRDIYVETANRMGGMTRQQGKVAVLALGYQGGVNSLYHMGAEGNTEQLAYMRDQWRRANRNIVALWRSTERAFGQGGDAGRLKVIKEGSSRHLLLPSGRRISYHGVRWEKYKVGPDEFAQGWRFDGARGRADTYGGRLVENAVQGIARDLLADLLLRLLDQGYQVVGHVHDEVIVQQAGLEQELVDAMLQAPGWASDLPLGAEAFSCERYRKG